VQWEAGRSSSESSSSLAMNGWGAAEPAWWLNLQAHPAAVVDLAGGIKRDHPAVSETRQQRWLAAVVGIGALFVGALELRNVPPNDRLLAVGLFAVGVLPGFAIMLARELYLRKSRKRPLDRPDSGTMVTLSLAFVGLAGLSRLLDPTVRVLAYGITAGLALGLVLFIGSDIRRLGRGSKG
jgi:hypothetical protein